MVSLSHRQKSRPEHGLRKLGRHSTHLSLVLHQQGLLKLPLLVSLSFRQQSRHEHCLRFLLQEKLSNHSTHLSHHHSCQVLPLWVRARAKMIQLLQGSRRLLLQVSIKRTMPPSLEIIETRQVRDGLWCSRSTQFEENYGARLSEVDNLGGSWHGQARCVLSPFLEVESFTVKSTQYINPGSRANTNSCLLSVRVVR